MYADTQTIESRRPAALISRAGGTQMAYETRRQAFTNDVAPGLPNRISTLTRNAAIIGSGPYPSGLDTAMWQHQPPDWRPSQCEARPTPTN